MFNGFTKATTSCESTFFSFYLFVVDLQWWWVTCLPLIWSFSLGSLWTWKRKFGTRSVTTPSARTSDPPVCANAKNWPTDWLTPCTLTNTGMLQVTHCLGRSASATSWRWSVAPSPVSRLLFPLNRQRLLLADRTTRTRRTEWTTTATLSLAEHRPKARRLQGRTAAPTGGGAAAKTTRS